MTDEQREEVEQGEAHWTPALLSDIRTRSADMGMEYLEEEVCVRVRVCVRACVCACVPCPYPHTHDLTLRS